MGGYRVFLIEGDTNRRVIMKFKDKFPSEPNFQMHYELLQSCSIVFPEKLRTDRANDPRNGVCIGFEQINPNKADGAGGSVYMSRWTYQENPANTMTRDPFTWQSSVFVHTMQDVIANNMTAGSTFVDIPE